MNGKITVEDVAVALETYGIATREEIDLVTAISGWTLETLNKILYYRTGYTDLESFYESEGYGQEGEEDF